MFGHINEIVSNLISILKILKDKQKFLTEFFTVFN